MAMSEEKLKVLQMIQDGKISASEGMELLKALEEAEPGETSGLSNLNGRFFRVRISAEGNTKVNVNVPLKLLKVVSKFAGVGMGFIPPEAKEELNRKGIDLSQIDLEELVRMIEEGLIDCKLVDIDVNDPEKGPVKVEVYVD